MKDCFISDIVKRKRILGIASRLLFVTAIFYFLYVLLNTSLFLLGGFGLWRPIIECNNHTYDYGSLTKTVDASPVVFSIRNRGSRPLKLTDVKPGCGGCVEVIDFSPTTIPPQSKFDLSVKLLVESLEGAVNKTIGVYSNDPVYPVFFLYLKATIHADSAEDKNDNEAIDNDDFQAVTSNAQE